METRHEEMRDVFEAAQAVAAAARGARLDERELVTLFFQHGFFAALGYQGIGEDIRLEARLRRGRADVILRSFTGRPIALIEYKRPGVDLDRHVEQLRAYARDLIPTFALLTNGGDLWLYRVRDGALEEPPRRFSLDSLTADEARFLFDVLHRREVDWTHLEDVKSALARARQDPVLVSAPDQAGGRQFLQRFALSPYSPFGRLTRALAEALPLLLHHSEFTRGAYAFWRQTYAREISRKEVLTSWKDLLPEGGRDALYHFMFALETAYVFLSRTLLAKAMSDAGFPHMDAIRALENALEQRHRRGRLGAEAYIVAAQAIFDHAALQAFRSLFESDIFDWWQDAHHLTDPWPLAEPLAEALVAIFDFDFSQLRGDLLGHLYQSYFDPETRKALGEFYTPPEVVDFILDSIDYRGAHVRTRRLLDPSCGSGTFIVHALQRYLAATEGTSPERVLRELVEGLRIVGFDVNPFAVLMAQVNYAAHILPLYARAIRDNRFFSLTTLPVFRTDSLRRETREAETEEVAAQKFAEAEQPGFVLTYEGGIAQVHVDLPVREHGKRDAFLRVKIPVPQYSEARLLNLVDNVEDYFIVLRAMFSAVREHATSESDLAQHLRTWHIPNAEETAAYLVRPVQRIVETMERLRTEYQDGRFLKTLEDLVLALLLKNDFAFDYVVGNPPYVRIQNIPELLRRYWAGSYAWAEGNYDIYIPFIERAVTEWLAEGGYLGIICSDRFLLANYARALRENLPEYADVRLIFDMRDTRVFRDALNYPAILIVQRRNDPQQETFIAARAFADPEEGPAHLVGEARRLIKRAREENTCARGEYVDAFPEKREHLTVTGWYLMPKRERAVFEKLETAGTHRLYELTVTQSGGFQGMATGLDDVLVLRLLQDEGDELVLEPKGGGGPVRIERALLRPWLFGRDVERWHIAWAGWYVFFPYIYIDDHYHLIPSTPYRRKFDFAMRADYTGPFIDVDYPLAWEYVTRHEERLRGRENGRYHKGTRDEHLWYGAARPQNLEYYGFTKVLLQVSSTSPDFALDADGEFVFAAGGTSGVYGIVFKDEIPSWFVVALLNSTILDFYLKHVSTVYSGHAYSYGDQFIKNLPIRLPQNKDEKAIAEALADLAQALTSTKGRLREWEKKRGAFPEPFLPELGQVELYPFSRLITGAPQARHIRIGDVAFQPQLDGRWAMTFGRTTLTFPSEHHARLAEAWLRVRSRASVPVDELLRLRVPVRPEDAQRLLNLLRAAEAEIERLQSRLDDGEAEVDRLVARLYGLKDEETHIIEDFLARF